MNTIKLLRALSVAMRQEASDPQVIFVGRELELAITLRVLASVAERTADELEYGE